MKRNNFKKILVIGCPGSGKSTLSRRLKSKLSLPLIHLDKYYHKPNWKEPNQSEWNKTLLNLMEHKSWIMDGNYAESFDIRFSKSDTIIYLDYSSVKCFFRVLKRIISDYGKARSDMAPGCVESIDFKFLYYVLTFNKKNRKTTYIKINKLSNKKNVIILQSDKQVDKFLRQLG